MKVEGALLRRLRTMSGWSLNGLAKEVEIDPGHLSRCENGTREMSKRVAQRIAGVLGVPLHTFYYQQDDEEESVA